MKEKKQLLLSIIGIGLLVFVLVGASYAFFSYLYNGEEENSINTGTILFTASDTTLELTNVFPTTKEEASDVATVSVQGHTTYEKGIDFTINAVDITSKNNEIIPTVTVTREEVDGITYTDGKDLITTYGKDNRLTSDTELCKGNIEANTTIGSEENLTKILTISVYYDKDEYHISDNMKEELIASGLLPSNYSGKIIDTETWNSLSSSVTRTINSAYSFRIEVIASEGKGSFLDQLEQKYELIYYSNFSDAIAEVNNGTIGEININNKEDAGACIYIDNGVTNVVLLKDTVLTTAVKPVTDMRINLGGYTLSSESGTAIAGESGNVYIDGSIPGSSIEIHAEGSVSARAITVNTNCNLTIEGGTYISDSDTGIAACILVKGSVTVNDATIISSTTNASRADGISLSTGGIANVSNSDITAINNSQKSYGIYVGKSCDVTVSNSDIKGYANYNHNGSSYTASSMGIYHSSGSVLTLNNNHVIGTVAGIQTYGTLYIDGGVIEGYGHGGIYFQGTNATSYIKNATISESDMISGFTNNTGSNHVGFYIGGNSGNVYMDNCDIISSGDSIVLRATSGEKNNSLYISNSRISEGSKIRIDNNNHKLYNGVGNNFTSADTTLPEAVTNTEVDYSTMFPEF